MSEVSRTSLSRTMLAIEPRNVIFWPFTTASTLHVSCFQYNVPDLPSCFALSPGQFSLAHRIFMTAPLKGQPHALRAWFSRVIDHAISNLLFQKLNDLPPPRRARNGDGERWVYSESLLSVEKFLQRVGWRRGYCFECIRRTRGARVKNGEHSFRDS
jgi:hypothetical protein